MSRGDRALWLAVAVLAALLIPVEMLLPDPGLSNIAVSVAALGVVGFAFAKQRGDGKTLRPIRPRDDKPRND